MRHNNSTRNLTPKPAAQWSKERVLSANLRQCLSAIVFGVGLLCIGALVDGVSEAHAQAQTEISPDEGVAAALFDRGMTLFEQGDFANAKKMFIESLERSSQGNRSADALRMLRSSNEKLGVSNLDAGLPGADQGNAPLDPYADKGGDETPVDPYSDNGAGDETPVDPYGVDPTDGVDPKPPVDEEATDEGNESMNLGRYGLIGHGGVLGSSVSLMLASAVLDKEADGEIDDVAGIFVFALGAGGGGYLAHYLTDRYELTDGQAGAVATAGFWTMYNAGHLANLFGGDTTNLNDIYLGMSIGGVAGTGLGAWYAKKYEPDVREISLVNSFSLYGTTTALMLGVAIDPPKNDAYSLNAVIGSVAGIGTAIYLRDELRYSRNRMLKIDMGAGIGALVPWITIYPLMSDDLTTRDEQTTGFFSAIGVGLGAYIAWAITKDSDDSEQDEAELSAAPPALLRRSAKGSWSLSSPMVRPMELPALAPRQGLLGTDILSGRF